MCCGLWAVRVVVAVAKVWGCLGDAAPTYRVDSYSRGSLSAAAPASLDTDTGTECDSPPPPPHLCAEGFQQLAASGVCTVGHLLGLCVGVFHTCSCSRVAVLHTCSCCFACFANTGRCHLSSAQPLRLCITNAPPGRLLSQLTRCFQTEPPHWPAAQSLLARPSSASLENSTLWAIAFGCWCGACWVLPGAHTELQGCCMWVGVGVV